MNNDELTQQEDTIKVFVFGILKSTGGAFHKDACINVEEDTLLEHSMYSVGGAYPASVKGCEGDIIKGETHTYLKSILESFDRIEGYDKEDPTSSFNLYTREKTITGNGHEVYYYLFNQSVEGMHKIGGGEWS